MEQSVLAYIQGTGTLGFIVRLRNDSALVVTAAHVVEGARAIDVEFFRARNVPLVSQRCAAGIDVAGPMPHTWMTVSSSLAPS